MQKYHGADQDFYDYLFLCIVEKGGLRMQIVSSDLGNLCIM